uniref:SCP domain-containing protein n=1 Tax=Caenorhabditis japonica TaxID=281687 RepID=A0A8R1ET62_CAEJA
MHRGWMTRPYTKEDVEEHSIVVDAWVSEWAVRGFSAIIFERKDVDRGIAHATQVNWAKAGQVGCGATICKSTKLVLVCQYDTFVSGFGAKK